MFNDEQKAHMRALADTPAEHIHWCGWFWVGEVGHETFHPDCPREFTAKDKLDMRCECCGNAPWIEKGGRLVHLKGCTLECRRDFYAAFDLGGES